jgi:tetratricopeptide (TPR) repeat protein
MLRRYLAQMLIPLIVLLLLAACGDEQAPEVVTTPGAAPSPAAETAVATDSADSADTPNAPFSLTVYATLGAEPVIHRGEPLLVEALLILTGDESTRIALTDGAPWTRALSLTLTDSNDIAVAAEWSGLEQAGTDLEFRSDAFEIRAVAALSPAAVDTLRPGDYKLTATFDARDMADTGAWAGRLSARGVSITVSDSARGGGEDEQIFSQRLLARWQQLDNQPQAALETLDAALQLSPGDIGTMSDKAEVLVELQRNDEAVELLQQAIALYGQRYPEDHHPPRELIHRLNELSPY